MGKSNAHYETRLSSLSVHGFEANRIILKQLASGQEVNLSRGRLVIEKDQTNGSTRSRRRLAPVLILVALFGSAATYATYHARLGQFRDTSGTPSLLATDDQVEIATTLSAMKPLEQSAAGQACHSKAPSHLIDFGGVQVVPGDGCIGYRVTSKKKEG